MMYYSIKKNGEIIAILEFKELLKDRNHNLLREMKGDIEIKEISEERAISLFRQNKGLCKENKTREKLEEKVFILEMIEKIKQQLVVEKDMDLILPEKAQRFLPQIQQELLRQGITLSHPIQECIHDIDPLCKFQSKLKREKTRGRDGGIGRDRGEESC